ncbi:MAG: GNAT family N-acetyltransferase [Microcoleus sp. PH2017_07_MST_O_A]|uniref:GNAT family N-acetyltransferase n=1 Tax=Microcoleus sp. PH2017_30_WIL_O_A TaxID=2798840 RepID=UPI001DED96D1|nr:GNAT family N-acetyltransferase [Microcoleus sp. PH2017_30_WIL_O_A]MCC3420561.1 GNAT family N-acetyltransferase [Microcoleus sp. PH2017_07_MST_O_A]MCC3588578.1 GNAT family N-acetyltransferase [Microcoleus sp. PH2017_30_WIL_O_A]TAE48623.1 MAG: N-acetyltransferase [Oscillatoriales cyanobacterium]
MDFCIRLASLEDIPKLTTLIPDSARALQADYYTSEQIEGAIGTVFGVDSQLIQDRTYFVAEHNNQIVGCGGWSQRKTLYGGDSGKNNQEDSLLNPDSDSAKIRAFFVDPARARQGIGSQIIQSCELAAERAGFKDVETIATLAGEPFYTKFGYRAIEQFEIPLPNNQFLPVVRMFKTFLCSR